VVEDVVTSGGQIILSTEELRTLGADIREALCVIDREQGGQAALSAADLTLISLLTSTNLKPTA
jgi:orotate phosphoribosyltransferase